MKKTLIFLCLLILIPATAQSIQTTVTPGISVRTTYTDNVDRVSDEQDPEYDFITTISPFISLTAEDRAYGATVGYSPTRVYYARTRDNQLWRHRFNLDAWSQFTRRLRFTIGGSYLQTEDPAAEQDDDFTVRQGRNKYYNYSAYTGLDYQFGPRDRIGLGFDYRRTENDDPTYQDSQYYRPSLDFSYWFTPQWGVELSGYFQRGEFDATEEVTSSDDFDRFFGAARIVHQFNRRISGNVQYAMNRVLYDGETEDERIHDISAGFDYQIGPDMDLAVQLGYSVVERPGLDNESGLSSDINFNKTYQSGSIGLNVSSGYDYNYFGAQNLGLNYYVGGGITADYALSRRLSVDAYARYRYIEYIDQIPQRNDDRFIAGCGLSFQLLQWLSAGAGYSYSTVESNIETNNYVENRVYISLTASPSQPFRLGN